MKAAGDPAEIIDHLADFGRHVLELPGQFFSAGSHRGLSGAQPETERDETLLGAVVKVTLEAVAGGVGGGHDPCP